MAKYFFLAGESSGDQHTARVIKSLKNLDKGSEIRFWGGDAMSEACSSEPEVHIKDLAFMGFWEVFKNILTIRQLFRKAKNDILKFQPDILVFVDYPGFNLRMAKWGKKQGFKIVYFISPQLWAWNEKRVHLIREYVDKMLVVLPFEQEFYQKHGVDVEYIGHPLIDAKEEFIPDNNFLIKNGIDKEIISCIPGSRKQEISKILPVMIEAVSAFSSKYQIVVPKAPNVDMDFYESILSAHPPIPIKFIGNAFYDILNNTKAALVTSGTATLETAIFGVPQVVCYKGHFLSYLIARRLVKVPYISLVNLISGQKIVEELIQDNCNAAKINIELNKLLSEPETIKRGYNILLTKIGKSGAPTKAAQAILALTSQK